MKKMLAVFIIVLFLASAISPVSIGFNDELVAPIETPTTSSDGPMDSAWPMYCHDTGHTSRSPYNTSGSNIEKWRFPIDDQYGVESGPVIANDGTIYFAAGMNFYAITSDFELKWIFHLEGVPAFGMHPAIDEDGTIYIGTYQREFFAINPNGTLKWKYNPAAAIVSSPAISQDGIIYFGDYNGYINAFYSNGTIMWRYKTNDVVLSSPAISDDGTIYCGSHDNNLYAIYPNGTLRWKFSTGGWIRTSPCIGDDGIIYVISFDNHLYALYDNGTLKWSKNIGQAGTSPTIGYDGNIYVGYTKLHSIYPENGTIKWVFDPGPDRCIRGSTPSNSIDGLIYFGTNIGETDGGEIIAIDNNGVEKWRKIIGSLWVESPPAIDTDGTIYIGSTHDGYGPGAWGYLHAFGPLTSNDPPDTPIFDGPLEGFVDKEYRYTIFTQDMNNNPISYFVDWGDGSNNEWSDDYAPGVIISERHIWEQQGNYTIKVKAKDTFGAESEWATLEVTMPRNKPILDLYQSRFPVLSKLFILLSEPLR